MKSAQIKIFANEADPSEKIVMVKGNTPGWGSAKLCQKALTAASAYALASTAQWWERTVNKPWRTATNLKTGGPVRYEKYREYNERVTRRILKLLKAKGVK